MIFVVIPCCIFASVSTSQSYIELFNEVCGYVEENYYDSTFIQEEFPKLKSEFLIEIQSVDSSVEYSELVNEMLGRFNASHTYYLTPDDYEYYHLAAAFSLNEKIQDNAYPTIGIITKAIDGHVFIASVLPGGIAEKAGLLMGDEIVSLNGSPFQAVKSLKDQIGRRVSITVKRRAIEAPRTFFLMPTLQNPKNEMLEAERASIRVIETQKNRIGYIHIYSYAGEEYHEELISAICGGPLANVDALIIDLRYGLGGADPTYLNIFNSKVPVIGSKDNASNTQVNDAQWRKPAVFLVNETVRSGKEILAFGARKYHLATVIGERTAGAVLGGYLIPMSNGDLLYLAVQSITVDGVNLEGTGVAPDIEVPMDIRFCEGKDVQLDSAVDYLDEIVKWET